MRKEAHYDKIMDWKRLKTDNGYKGKGGSSGEDKLRPIGSKGGSQPGATSASDGPKRKLPVDGGCGLRDPPVGGVLDDENAGALSHRRPLPKIARGLLLPDFLCKAICI